MEGDTLWLSWASLPANTHCLTLTPPKSLPRSSWSTAASTQQGFSELRCMPKPLGPSVWFPPYYIFSPCALSCIFHYVSRFLHHSTSKRWMGWWGGFAGSGVLFSDQDSSTFPHGPGTGGQPCTIIWTSHSAEPYKVFKSQSQTWSSRKGSRTARLCPWEEWGIQGEKGKTHPLCA